jgi:hypothetical protein
VVERAIRPVVLSRKNALFASEAENHSPAPPAVEGHTIRWLNA